MLKLKHQYFGHLMRTAVSLEKSLMLGKTEKQKEKRTSKDEMAGWHHRRNGHEFEPTLGDEEGQSSLVCCSLWGSQKVGHSQVTEQQHHLHLQKEIES